MQPNLSESNSVNYEDSSANFITQLAGGQLAEGAIKGLGSGDFGKNWRLVNKLPSTHRV